MKTTSARIQSARGCSQSCLSTDWTASEHTPAHSDQTIDPETLSNLFENLIAVTDNDTPTRMPKGTYYTPADVANEMVKDALMMAVKDYAPKSWKERDMLSLWKLRRFSSMRYPDGDGQTGKANRIADYARPICGIGRLPAKRDVRYPRRSRETWQTG